MTETDRLVGLAVALKLEGLTHEGAHHPDAHDLLAQYPVDVVDPCLHGLEEWQQAEDEEADDHEERDDRGPDEPGQPQVLAQRHDEAADAHDRRRNHEVQRHEREHLHLLYIVRATRNEGAGADLRRLEDGQGVDLLVDLAAEVAPHCH